MTADWGGNRTGAVIQATSFQAACGQTARPSAHPSTKPLLTTLAREDRRTGRLMCLRARGKIVVQAPAV